MAVPRVERFTAKDFLDFLENPDYERFLYHESYRWVVRAQEYTKPPRSTPPRVGLDIILSSNFILVARRETRAAFCQLRDGDVLGNVYVYLPKNGSKIVAAHDISSGLRIFATKLWPKIPWRVHEAHIFVSGDRQIFVWATEQDRAAACYLAEVSEESTKVFPEVRVSEISGGIVVITEDRAFVLDLDKHTVTETELLDSGDNIGRAILP